MHLLYTPLQYIFFLQNVFYIFRIYLPHYFYNQVLYIGHLHYDVCSDYIYHVRYGYIQVQYIFLLFFYVIRSIYPMV